MTADLAIVLLLLAAAITLFALNRPRMDVVALLMMTVLPLTGLISMEEALAGFSDANVVLIGALFVLGDGLARTGVARRMGDWLLARSARSETRLIVLLMILVAGVGSVMSSTAVVTIFIPVVLRLARDTGLPPGRLMMPLSFAALHSGMLTLIATPPNLVVHSELVRSGFAGFHFFSITPFGLVLLALGIGYMLVARRWLGRSEPESGTRRMRPRLAEWIERYGLTDREFRLRVQPGSPLAGRMLRELDLRGSAGANILAIERSGRFAHQLFRADATTVLAPGDILFIDVFEPTVDIDAVSRRFGLERLPLSGGYFGDQAGEIGMVEVLIPPDSTLVGRTIVEARIRSVYGMTVVGLRRGTEPLGQGLREEKLRAGDRLLLAGRWRQIGRLRSAAGEVILLDLPTEFDEAVPAADRAPHALLVLGLVIGLMVTGAVPNVQAALLGCLLMGFLGCIDLESAYRSIHWQSIFLIVGMLPFALALQATGGVDLAAGALLGLAGEAGPRLLLAALFLITALFGLFISNTATAVLMAPVALGVADALDASPLPFAMIVALAASCAFMTPVSSPVNTLVVGPGNYRFVDFVRIGVPFTLLALVVCVVLVPWLMPL